jgi:hypothetical protein
VEPQSGVEAPAKRSTVNNSTGINFSLEKNPRKRAEKRKGARKYPGYSTYGLPGIPIGLPTTASHRQRSSYDATSLTAWSSSSCCKDPTVHWCISAIEESRADITMLYLTCLWTASRCLLACSLAVHRKRKP